MKTRAVAVVILALLAAGVGPLQGGDDTKDAAIKKDRKLYKGAWRVVSLERDGIKADYVAAQWKIIVVNEADGNWKIEFNGKEVARGTSTIDPTERPKIIDLVTTDEAFGLRETTLGIYEIDKDTRKVCLAKPGERRPTAFASKPGSGLTLVTFKREKP
jgi:uncharacterized protein (TIGR03067 family)